MEYQNEGLVVDLSVGLWAWPLPMDYDGDGDLDLVVSCPDKPSNGTYLFENRNQSVWPAGRRIAEGMRNVQVSYVEHTARVLLPGIECLDFPRFGYDRQNPLGLPTDFHRPIGRHSESLRAGQWKYVDWEADGDLDLLIGVGDWSDYGWDDAYDSQGRWTHGPLHGFVYIVENEGSHAQPQWRRPRQVVAAHRPLDVYGWPSPNLEDFDGDGDLDLLCGEFLDAFTYFPNLGTRSEPVFGVPRRLTRNGKPLTMDLQMIIPVAVDWDSDGDPDLVVGDEDGRVAWLELLDAKPDQTPRFSAPRYLQQHSDLINCGALATPVACDWDSDGDQDLLCGNTAGYILWIENLSPAPTSSPQTTPRFAAPQRLKAGGSVLRIQAGTAGSIQGPAEAKWGYTTLSAADWDHDGLLDLIVNSIWGKVVWYRNQGRPGHPQLQAAQPVLVQLRPEQPVKPDWTWWTPEPGELVTQWRTTPVVVDLDKDGLNDLVMLDPQGYLSWYQRRRDPDGSLQLLGPSHVLTDTTGQPLQLNDQPAGKSGRRKLTLADWDGDGQFDLLVNGQNADWYRGREPSDGLWRFEFQGPLSDMQLSSHSTSPTTVDWNQDGIADLVVGAEDGCLYYLPNPRSSDP